MPIKKLYFKGCIYLTVFQCLDLYGSIISFVLQAQRWCDDGAYLLANQQVDKFQSKEGAQTALRDIEKFHEAAPPLLSAGTDVLFLEFESVLTPYLQVNTDRLQKRLDTDSIAV